MITSGFPYIKNEPLVPVADAQRNLTAQFKKGLVRITKSGKSLGYLISDEMMMEMMEDIEALNPRFLEEMEKTKATDKSKLVSLEDAMKEFDL